MKLLIAVIQRQDEAALTRALAARRIGVTRVSSQGGFLREGNVTLFIVIPDHRVDEVMSLIREHCHTRTRYVAPLPPVAESGEFYPSTPIEVQVGGATVFVLDAEVLGRA
ncbi:cyclic-di-AMP receptor [Kallotenue papyrolyticum]|uniref:cyclic-di-AMP receptor n=1 Tax=Kallotenue papyrolyticum TaxID=1325125 RepID=UPI0004785ECD|nr:cyclic-di-AMP receptor [Kallotenue papyrolyticum]